MLSDKMFNYRRVRGALAERMVSQKELAGASRLSHHLVNRLLNGHEPPGELARYKLRDGLESLGIDTRMVFTEPTESETKE